MAKQWTASEYNNLYRSSVFLSKENKIKLGLLMPVDVYVQDPLVAEQNRRVALATIHVPAEPELMDGPTSARIAVVDWDGDRGRLEQPAWWDAESRCFVFDFRGKPEPITRERCTEPQFHQVNVWAIIRSVLDIYEERWVLGRSAPWAFEGNRLIVVPHAGYLANAFYDRRSKSIQFYYFGTGDERVYTCLSHDIIAHEAGHAILDGLRPLYNEDSSLQTTAFHEFIADLTAIMTALLNQDILSDVAKQSGGDLRRDTIVSSLAEDFGQYATGRPYLRSAQDTNGKSPKTIEEVKNSGSPYDWSEVLTKAMFDILKGIVDKQMQKNPASHKESTVKGILLSSVDLFRRVALQPLDYLPPVDVQFSDYVQAVLEADQVADPADRDGYRDLMRDCFDNRGIACLAGAEELDRLRSQPYDIERVSRSRADAYRFLNENRCRFCIPVEQDIGVVDLHQSNKIAIGGGKLPQEVVLQYAWREGVELTGSNLGFLAGTTASLLCGGTLVFDGRGNLLSWMHKPGTGKQEPFQRDRRRYCDDERARGEQRREALVAYIKDRVEQGYVGLIDRDRPEEIDARPPVVASRREDGTLRLEVAPHLRHWAPE